MDRIGENSCPRGAHILVGDSNGWIRYTEGQVMESAREQS